MAHEGVHMQTSIAAASEGADSTCSNLAEKMFRNDDEDWSEAPTSSQPQRVRDSRYPYTSATRHRAATTRLTEWRRWARLARAMAVTVSSAAS